MESPLEVSDEPVEVGEAHTLEGCLDEQIIVNGEHFQRPVIVRASSPRCEPTNRLQICRVSGKLRDDGLANLSV